MNKSKQKRCGLILSANCSFNVCTIHLPQKIIKIFDKSSYPAQQTEKMIKIFDFFTFSPKCNL